MSTLYQLINNKMLSLTIKIYIIVPLFILLCYAANIDQYTCTNINANHEIYCNNTKNHQNFIQYDMMCRANYI